MRSIIPDATKTVEWSYATSDNAKRFGFYKTGCYTVDLRLRSGGRIEGETPLAGFATKSEALQYANGLKYEWCPLTLRFHPEYAEQKGGAL